MNNIRLVTIIFAVVLMVVGIAAYVGSGMEHITALIPAFIGAALALCAGLAGIPGWRKHVMHVAMLLALIGIGGSFGGLLKIPSLISGEAELPLAIIVRSATAVILIAYLAIGIRSFIVARRARQAEPNTAEQAVDPT